jgi:hypothetical protein
MTTLASPLTFIASDAAAAFCFFSAEGKEKGIMIDLIFYFTKKNSPGKLINNLFLIK